MNVMHTKCASTFYCCHWISFYYNNLPVNRSVKNDELQCCYFLLSSKIHIIICLLNGHSKAITSFSVDVCVALGVFAKRQTTTMTCCISYVRCVRCERAAKMWSGAHTGSFVKHHHFHVQQHICDARMMAVFGRRTVINILSLLSLFYVRIN